MLEAIAIRLEAIATRMAVEAVAIRLEAIGIVMSSLLQLGWASGPRLNDVH